MTDFIVDESRFIIQDEESQAYFEPDYELPSGIVIGEMEDCTDKWQLYISDDSKYYVLAVIKDLHDRWIEGNLLSEKDFEKVTLGNLELYLLFSSTVQRVDRLTNIRCGSSLHYINALYSSFIHTRQIDVDSNLRDAIYFEKKSLILPTYSLVGKVSDRALFENALRGKNDPENLTPPDGMNDSVSYFYLRKLLSDRGFTLNPSDPLLECGEKADDFLFGKENNALVTVPLIIRDHYQVFDTTSDMLLLIMDTLWAEALMSTRLVNLIELNSLPLGGRRYFSMTFKKDQAVECMDDLHYGLNYEGAFKMAQAIRRTRSMLPNCDLTRALYIEKVGIMLPELFSKAENTNDRELMRSCLKNGPYATAPFMEDINADLMSVADNK